MLVVEKPSKTTRPKLAPIQKFEAGLVYKVIADGD